MYRSTAFSMNKTIEYVNKTIEEQKKRIKELAQMIKDKGLSNEFGYDVTNQDLDDEDLDKMIDNMPKFFEWGEYGAEEYYAVHWKLLSDGSILMVDSWGIAGGNYINIKYRICDTNLCATARIIERMEEQLGTKTE